MANFDPMNDPFALVRKMWGGMGFNLPNLPNLITPTFDAEEIDKKIKDLKAVESWLKMNLSMLQATIQGLEMQVVTLNAVRAMGQMATNYGAGMDGSSPGTNLTSGNGDTLKQAALWPLTLMQQMQEQIQKAASTAAAVVTPAATNSEETPGSKPAKGKPA